MSSGVFCPQGQSDKGGERKGSFRTSGGTLSVQAASPVRVHKQIASEENKESIVDQIQNTVGSEVVGSSIKNEICKRKRRQEPNKIHV